MRARAGFVMSMRSVRGFLASLLLLAAACSGSGSSSTGNTTSGTDGGTGNPTWHEAALGTSLDVLEEFGLHYAYAVAVDTTGAPLVARIDRSSPSTMRVDRWNGSAWTELAPSPVTAGATAGYPTVAVLGDGSVVAAWCEVGGRNGVFAARWSGAAWTPLGGQLSVPGDTVYSVAVVAGATGPVVVWSEGPYNVTAKALLAASWDGATWNRLGAGLSTTMFGTPEPAVTALPSGEPVVLTVEGGSASFTANRWDAGLGAWVALPSADGTGDGHFVDLAADESGALYAAATADVSAMVPTDVLRLAPGATAWSSIGLPTGTASAGLAGPPRLAALPGGGVALAWEHGYPSAARWTSAVTGWQSAGTASEAPGQYVIPAATAADTVLVFWVDTYLASTPTLHASSFQLR